MQINCDLGAHQGSKHTSPDLECDIEELMCLLAKHSVYTMELGHTIDDNKGIVLNTTLLRLSLPVNPLHDFNISMLN